MIIFEIITVIGAIAAIIAAIFQIRNDKGRIRKRIEHKKKQLRKVNFELREKYGNRNFSHRTPEDAKKEKLERQIEELEKRL